MHILALETSTKNFSLAVCRGQKVLRHRNIRTEKILESSIIPAIDKILKASGLGLAQLDALAVGLGPGSFTSLRVGLSTAKAFALATGIKMIGLCSLDILASAVTDWPCDEICVIVDARRGKLYAAIYDQKLNRKMEPALLTLEDLLGKVRGRTLFVGDGLKLYQDPIMQAYKAYNARKRGGCEAVFAPEKFWYPKAKDLAKLAMISLSRGEFQDPSAMTPIYLYPQDCQVSKR